MTNILMKGQPPCAARAQANELSIVASCLKVKYIFCKVISTCNTWKVKSFQRGEQKKKHAHHMPIRNGTLF